MLGDKRWAERAEGGWVLEEGAGARMKGWEGGGRGRLADGGVGGDHV